MLSAPGGECSPHHAIIGDAATTAGAVHTAILGEDASTIRRMHQFRGGHGGHDGIGTVSRIGFDVVVMVEMTMVVTNVHGAIVATEHVHPEGNNLRMNT